MIDAQFNPHVANLTAPAIPLALSWADSYDHSYGPLIDLSQAVPNYPPHADMLTSLAAHAGSSGSAGYGEIQGEAALRDAYASHVSDVYTSTLSRQNIHITSGCNQAFVATLMALTQAGDRVVMTNPCYFNHEATAKMLGLNIRYAPCDQSNGFTPSTNELLSMLDDTVKVVALVSPNNPTGAVYPAELLTSVFKACQRKGIWLILDETYRDFLPQSQRPCHQLFRQENWQQTFVQLYSFSKVLCIPGHRLGAITAGEDLVNQVAKVMDNLQICAPRAAQLSTAELLGALDEWREFNLAEITARAKVFVKTMTELPQWQVTSIGAYFAYVQHPFRHLDSAAAVQKMAQIYGVLPLPGAFFGFSQERYIRMAFANVDVPTLEKLGARLAMMENEYSDE